MHVTLDRVSKTFYDSDPPLGALAPTTLEVASGAFVCLIGPSGCGKTTLLRLVADQLPPTSGTIRLDGGLPPSAVRARKEIAWMAQNPALLPWMTVMDNVTLPQQVNAQTNGAAALAPSALLRMVGLHDFAATYPHTLSGGMQQRVALARALATGASLWLMDEPFAALDDLTRETLTHEVLQLWADFRPTVLWVTHNIAEAVRMADRVVVMSPRPGQIRTVVEAPLARPRDETSPEAVALIRQLKAALRQTPRQTSQHLPERVAQL